MEGLKVAVEDNTKMIKRQADTMQELVGCVLSMSKTIANIGNKTDIPDQDRRPGRQTTYCTDGRQTTGYFQRRPKTEQTVRPRKQTAKIPQTIDFDETDT